MLLKFPFKFFQLFVAFVTCILACLRKRGFGSKRRPLKDDIDIRYDCFNYELELIKSSCHNEVNKVEGQFYKYFNI